MLLILLGALFIAGLIAKIHDLTKTNQALRNENYALWLANNRQAWEVEKALSELELTCKEHQITCYYHGRNRRVKNVNPSIPTRH